MKKNRLQVLSLVLMLSISLSGCGIKDNNSKDSIKGNSESAFEKIENSYLSVIPGEYDYFNDYVIKNNEELVYNIFKGNIGVYNVDDKKWTQLYEQETNNVFSYYVRGVDIGNTFFSIGSSSFNKFSLVKVNGQVASSIFNVNQSDSIIPIGYYDDNMYFIYNYDDLSDNETRSIVYLKDNEFSTVIALNKALVSNAVIIGETLYYAIYLPEQDIFELYSYSLSNKESGNEPVKVKEIHTDKIFRMTDKLVYVNDNNELVDLDGKVHWKLEVNSDIDVISDYNYLLEVYIGQSNDVECKVVNLNNNSIVNTILKFDGYRVKDGMLKLYCEGNIMEIEVGKNNE